MPLSSLTVNVKDRGRFKKKDAETTSRARAVTSDRESANIPTRLSSKDNLLPASGDLSNKLS